VVEPTRTRIVGWGARAIFVGPAFELTAHTNGVSLLCTGVGGDVFATDEPTRPASEWTRCRSVFVPAGTHHTMRFEAGPIACFYLDPASSDVSSIAEAMKKRRGQLLFTHGREPELMETLAAFAAGKLGREPLRTALARVLHLETPAPPSDPRVARAIRRIREDPAGAHSLRSLAQEVGLSESRLRHAFKAATGVPLKRFRVWTRIGTALRLAQQGGTLTEAAIEAGFSSSAHFSNAYRAMFGGAPSALIESQRKSQGP
jgi:AraC-like DNA-binding protein